MVQWARFKGLDVVRKMGAMCKLNAIWGVDVVRENGSGLGVGRGAELGWTRFGA